MLETLQTIIDLATIVLGFGLIIAIHEAGHFVAARWAGIRVLAFAIGFGRPLLCYRKGMGVTRASTEPEYQRLRERAGGTRGEQREQAREQLSRMSPTEYRLNLIPLGGYVKMLGQDDADPTAKSDAPDSYQNCPPAKRMVVISAGVVANLVTAAALFIVVFTVGLRAEAPVIGDVIPGKPAALAVAINADALGITDPGLMPGDRVIELDGRDPRQFSELFMKFAMAARGQEIPLSVQRAGYDQPLQFSIAPERDPDFKNLLTIGIFAAASDTLMNPSAEAEREQVRSVLRQAGLDGVEPGMRLVSIDGVDVDPDGSPIALARSAFARGEEVTLAFAGDSGARVERTLSPRPQLQLAAFGLPQELPRRLREGVVSSEHLLGLMPVMTVNMTGEAGERAGLRAGDVFVLLGDRSWPSVPEATSAIRGAAGKSIRVIVDRPNADGTFERVDLGEAPVSKEGTIGFAPTDSARFTNRIARWPSLPTPSEDLKSDRLAGPNADVVELASLPGARVVEAGGRRVPTLESLRNVLRDLTSQAAADGEGAEIELVLELDLEGSPSERGVVRLSADEVEALHALGYTSPVPPQVFDPLMVLVKGEGPGEAVMMGLHETRRILERTYLTLSRLFEGTIGVQHLNGPVGIAHTGTLIARRGLIWVLFFMALVSVNLAVVNFLPIPITDGGQMLFLIYEQFTGKAPSDRVLNIATLAGLVLIVGVFLVVTFNDLRNLLGL